MNGTCKSEARSQETADNGNGYRRYRSREFRHVAFPVSISPLFDVLVVFVSIRTSYFLSRRFEYAADAAGVELTRDLETAIHALVNLHCITEAPRHCDKLTELFMAHSALTRRAHAIGEKGRISPDRTREAIGENEAARHVR
jgi:Zn-dependent protease with chaperone function